MYFKTDNWDKTIIVLFKLIHHKIVKNMHKMVIKFVKKKKTIIKLKGCINHYITHSNNKKILIIINTILITAINHKLIQLKYS